MKKTAFTMAESLVVISIIGFLAVILLNSIGAIQPDKEKAMFKKAYQITERTVGELINDEAIYAYDQDRIGFYNTDKAYVEGTTDSYGGDGQREEKFCQFFARKLNTYRPAEWDAANKQCTFQTTDGVSWIVPSAFEAPQIDAAGVITSPGVTNVRITVDINGTIADGGKGPDSDDDSNSYRDVYTIIVDFDGRVRVDGDRETEFLKSHDAKKNHR